MRRIRHNFRLNSGLSIMEVLVAALVLLLTMAAFVKFSTSNKQSETKSTGLSGQIALLYAVQARINNRTTIQTFASSSSKACFRGQGCPVAAAGFSTSPFAVGSGTNWITGSSPTALARYTLDGTTPCAMGLGSSLTTRCPLGVWSELVLECVGRCQRASRVTIRTHVRHVGRSGEETLLSSASLGDVEVGLSEFIAGGCNTAGVESALDPTDPGSPARAPLSAFDKALFYGFEQGFSSEYPSIVNRDHSNYCRRLILNNNPVCPIADGGISLGVNRNTTTSCTRRSNHVGPVGACPAPPPGPIVTPPPTPPPGALICSLRQAEINIVNTNANGRVSESGAFSINTDATAISISIYQINVDDDNPTLHVNGTQIFSNLPRGGGSGPYNQSVSFAIPIVAGNNTVVGEVDNPTGVANLDIWIRGTWTTSQPDCIIQGGNPTRNIVFN